MPAEGERETSRQSSQTRLTRKLTGPTVEAVAAPPRPPTAAAVPVKAAAAAQPSGKVRGSLYMAAADKASLTWMVDQVFFDARGACNRHEALGALIHAVRANFDGLKHQALAELLGRPADDEQVQPAEEGSE